MHALGGFSKELGVPIVGGFVEFQRFCFGKVKHTLMDSSTYFPHRLH